MKTGLEDKELKTGAGFELFQGRLFDEQFYCLTVAEKAKEMGVPKATVQTWERKVDWEAVARHFRAQYAKYKPQIDRALINIASRGNVNAIELFYQKYEGWSAKTGMDITVRKEFDGFDNKTLVRELFKGMTEEEKKEFLETQKGKEEPGEETGRPGRLTMSEINE